MNNDDNDKEFKIDKKKERIINKALIISSVGVFIAFLGYLFDKYDFFGSSIFLYIGFILVWGGMIIFDMNYPKKRKMK